MLNKEEFEKSKKDEEVRYALDKMGASASDFVSEKHSEYADEKPKGNVLVRAASIIIPMKGDSKGEIARKIFLIVSLIVFIAALSYLIWEITGINSSYEQDKELGELAGSPYVDVEVDMNDYTVPPQVQNPITTQVTGPGTEDPEYTDLTPVKNTPLNINWQELWKINPDIKGWIKLTGTLINYPVLQSGDNDYYLYHDIYKNRSSSACIISSYLNTWDENDDNLVLFGHNMQAGTMFSYLVHYVPNDYSKEPLAFYKVHPTIQLATPDGRNETYKIFAGCYLNTQENRGEVFQYVNKTKFSSVDDFNNFILGVMDRSWFYTDVDLTYGDDILTLSTCSWPLGRAACDTRWVVFARRVREGESETVDTTVAKRNYNPKLFTYWYQARGGSWKGRTWDTSKLLSY